MKAATTAQLMSSNRNLAGEVKNIQGVPFALIPEKIRKKNPYSHQKSRCNNYQHECHNVYLRAENHSEISACVMH